MQLIKKIGNISLVVLCILSAFLSIFYVIYHYNFKSDTLSTYYIGNQTPTDLISISDSLSEEKIAEYEKRVLLNVNLFSNENDNGLPLSELRLDYFTDPNMDTNSCRSSGIQLFFDLADFFDFLYGEDNSRIDEYMYFGPDGLEFNFDINPYYYETYREVSWGGSNIPEELQNPLDRNKSFIVKINDTPYLFKLDGTYKKTVTEGWWIFKSTKTKTYNYNYIDLMIELLTSVKNNSLGDTDFYLAIDLSKYFTNIKEYNYETKQFDKKPLVDISNKYCMMKFHYSKNGAINSSDSMFGLIKGNASYGKTPDSSTEYWKAFMRYNYTVTNLNKRYSEQLGGYMFSIPFDEKSMYSDMSDYEINIVIDLNSTYLKNNDISFAGFDYNAFENVKINSLTILGEGNVKFLDKAFYNTGLKTFSHSSGVTFDLGSDVFNSDYTEVIL